MERIAIGADKKNKQWLTVGTQAIYTFYEIKAYFNLRVLKTTSTGMTFGDISICSLLLFNQVCSICVRGVVGLQIGDCFYFSMENVFYFILKQTYNELG